jgi:hypothetical protein
MYQKGQSGNVNGRPVGALNHSTKLLRETITKVVGGYINSTDFSNDLAQLEPKERLKAITDLSAFILPKLAAQTLDITEESKKSFGDELSRLKEEEELRKISPF